MTTMGPTATRRLSLRLATLALALLACTPEPAVESDALTRGDCEGQASTEFELARDLEVALREIARHGVVMSGFAHEAMEAPVQTLIANRPGSTGFDDLQDGWYVKITDNGTSRSQLSVRFRAGRDYGFASAGEAIGSSLFWDGSYLVNAQAWSEPPYTVLYFNYPGRLAELLGLGSMLTSPLTLNHEEVAGLNDGISELELEGMLEVDKEFASGTSVSYVVEFTPTRTDEFGQAIEVTLVSLEAHDEDGRILVAGDWDMQYVLGALDGTFEFDVRGGGSSYSGMIGDGELVLSCE